MRCIFCACRAQQVPSTHTSKLKYHSMKLYIKEYMLWKNHSGSFAHSYVVHLSKTKLWLQLRSTWSLTFLLKITLPAFPTTASNFLLPTSLSMQQYHDWFKSREEFSEQPAHHRFCCQGHMFIYKGPRCVPTQRGRLSMGLFAVCSNHALCQPLCYQPAVKADRDYGVFTCKIESCALLDTLDPAHQTHPCYCYND